MDVDKACLSRQDLACGEVDHLLVPREQRPVSELLLHLDDLPVGVVVVPCGERGSSDDVVHERPFACSDGIHPVGDQEVEEGVAVAVVLVLTHGKVLKPRGPLACGKKDVSSSYEVPDARLGRLQVLGKAPLHAFAVYCFFPFFFCEGFLGSVAAM